MGNNSILQLCLNLVLQQCRPGLWLKAPNSVAKLEQNIMEQNRPDTPLKYVEQYKKTCDEETTQAPLILLHTPRIRRDCKMTLKMQGVGKKIRDPYRFFPCYMSFYHAQVISKVAVFPMNFHLNIPSTEMRLTIKAYSYQLIIPKEL